jgi:PKD repeat protein
MEMDLSALNYSTYLGGLYDEKANGIAVDANGTAFVVGYTNSENFPRKCEIQPEKGLGYLVPDAFITQINQTGKGLVFSTYLGGTYYDEGTAIAVTDDGLNITVTGYTESINFPTWNAYQPDLAGFPAVRFTDAFVTKINKIPPVANFTANPPKGCSPVNISFKDNSTNNPIAWRWEFGDNTPNSTLQNPNHRYYNNCSTLDCGSLNYTVNLTVWNCDGSNTTSRNVTICPNLWYNITANQSAQGCVGANDTLQFIGYQKSGGPLVDPFWWFNFGDNKTGSYPSGNINKFTNTSNFTVTFWVQNECCNNSTTMVVDIRAKPIADFYGIPTSGLIPLSVNFFDNSSGRPDNWTWSYRNDTVWTKFATTQNTTFTFSSKGAYDIKMKACNFCGCNETKPNNNYIKAGIPNLTFSPGMLIVPTNDTTPISLKLEIAENGLSGYNLLVKWDDSIHGNITGVIFPPWALNSSYSPLPNYLVTIQAVDFMDQVTSGAMNIQLATFNLIGNISTFQSNTSFSAIVNELDDDSGNPIYTSNIPANITVVRLLPFPGKTLPPTDPYQNQKYWDVNGNDNIDFDDVVTYFNNMQWIRDYQYIPFFDYNGNGLIDFADLIRLFHEV